MCWTVPKKVDDHENLAIVKRDVSVRSHRSCLDVGQPLSGRHRSDGPRPARCRPPPPGAPGRGAGHRGRLAHAVRGTGVRAVAPRRHGLSPTGRKGPVSSRRRVGPNGPTPLRNAKTLDSTPYWPRPGGMSPCDAAENPRSHARLAHAPAALPVAGSLGRGPGSGCPELPGIGVRHDRRHVRPLPGPDESWCSWPSAATAIPADGTAGVR